MVRIRPREQSAHTLWGRSCSGKLFLVILLLVSLESAPQIRQFLMENILDELDTLAWVSLIFRMNQFFSLDSGRRRESI